MEERKVALYVLCAGMLMIVLDVTVVNVALPYVQDDLGFDNASLAWVVNSYLIAFAGLLLLAGRLGDLLGRRRVLNAGLAVFTLSSLACGAAQTQGMLIAARFVQGVGGALASAVILGMIVTLFPEEREQAKALGVYGFVASAGGCVGLVAGGVLTEVLDWHWCFLVNVPIGVLAIYLVRRFVPDESGLGLSAGADVPGAVLITSALMLGVYALVGPAADRGFSDPLTLVLGALAVALLGAFGRQQARAATPLVPLRVLRSRTTVAANVVQLLTVAGMFGMFFLSSLYLQRVLAFSAFEIGMAFLPTSLVMAVISLRVSDRLVGRYGAWPVLVAGSATTAVGLLLLTQISVDGTYWADVLPGGMLLGVGAGVGFPALMSLAMSGATDEDAGLLSGLVGTTAEAGGALGLAVLATLANGRTGASTDPQALVDGYQLAFWVGTGLLAAATAVTVVWLRPARSALPVAPALVRG